jgi:hypothetical protein
VLLVGLEVDGELHGEDGGGGGTWSPGAVSRWFELASVAAPSADEGEAIPHLGWRRRGTAVAGGDEQRRAARSRAERSEARRAREGREVEEELLPCPRAGLEAAPTWGGGHRRRPVRRRSPS